MTVPEIEPVITYSGNGSTTQFDFSFLINATDELLVQYTDSNGNQSNLTLNVDYSINEVGNINGSYINYPLGASSYATLATDEKITLSLNLEYKQDSDFSASGSLSLIVLENTFDYVTKLIQMVKRITDRCVKVQEGSSTDPTNLMTELATDVGNAANSASIALTAASVANTAQTNASASATIASNAAASVNFPTAVGNGLNFIRQKLAENGFEYRTPKQLLTDITMDDIKYRDVQFIQFNDKKKLVLKAGTLLRLVTDTDTRYYRLDANLIVDVITILDTGTTLQNGKNYYVYLVSSGSGVDLKVSLNSTYPTGYTTTNSRKIGGFHTLCVDVGTIAGHTLTGYSAGDIIPCSVWSLTHRPVSNPEGMVFVKEIDAWVDIYLQSGTGVNTASAYGATVTDTRPWSDHADDMAQVFKRLSTDAEFAQFAEGSNQKTSIYGSASPTPKTSGGHLDTASRRMISNYGIEEACGFLWQWIDNPSANGGSGWTNHDALAGAKGQLYGSSLALLAGGDWTNGASCGSRSRDAISGRASASADVGGRGVSSPKRN